MSKFPKPTKLYSPELVRMNTQYQKLQSCLVLDSIALDLEHVYHCQHDVTHGSNPGLVPPNTPRGALPNPYFPEEEDEVVTEEVPEVKVPEVEVPEPVVTEFVEPVPNEVTEEVPAEVPVKPRTSFFDVIRAAKRKALVDGVERARLAPRRETQGAPSSLPPVDKTEGTV